MADGLDFLILGALEARRDGRLLNLGGVRQRGVLALLLLHPNETISGDRLIDELWADDPPRDAVAALQAHVSRLRKLLEPDHGGAPSVLVTSAGGYRIVVGPEALDLLRFERLVDDGRRMLDSGDTPAAADVLGEALGLWRGRPLADLEAEAFAEQPIRDLDELWLDAVELRIDADLANGRHADLTRELAALTRRHPVRERLRAQLMLALYRSGRQAEALEAFADLRRTLVEERGLEPGPDVRALQEAILRQDAGLELRSRGRSPTRPGPHRRWIAGAVAAAVAAAAVAAIAWPRAGDHRPPASSGFVAVVSPDTGAVRAHVAVGVVPSAVAIGHGHVWVVNAGDQTIARIDQRTLAVDTFAVGATPTDVAVGAGGVWVGSAGRVRSQAHGLVTTALARMDLDTRAPRATIALPRATANVADGAADRVAATARSVWAIAPDGRVVRIDPRTNRVTGTVAAVRARAIAADATSLWTLAEDGRVARVDARSGVVVSRGRVPAGAVASIAAGAGGAWVSAPADGVLWHVVPGRGEQLVMRTIAVAPGTTDLAYGAGALWALNPLRGTLARVSGSAVRTIAIGGFPRSVAVDGDGVWVAAAAAPVAPTATTAIGIAAPRTTSCQRPFYGGDRPAQLLVVSDLPLQGGLQVSSQQMVDAMGFVLRRHSFRAGRWRIALQPCDDALAATRLPDSTTCAANARAYGRAPAVVAVLGPLNSDCALAAIPELGRAPGPLAMVSPLASYVGLTRVTPGTPPGELRALYPSSRRNFLRVFPTDQHQVAALGLLAKRLGRTRIYVLDDGDGEYGRLAADQFVRSARSLGLRIAGRARWSPGSGSQRALAEHVARARPQAVFLGGRVESGGPAVVRALRSRLGDRVALLAPDGFTPVPALVEQAGAAASQGVLIALTGVSTAEQFGSTGRRFARELGATLAGEPVEPGAIYAAQAMEVTLDAIARSDGTRASVLTHLLDTDIADGLIGPVRFDANGDVRHSPITILRVAPGSHGTADQPDVVVDRVLHVPTDLLR